MFRQKLGPLQRASECPGRGDLVAAIAIASRSREHPENQVTVPLCPLGGQQLESWAKYRLCFSTDAVHKNQILL